MLVGEPWPERLIAERDAAMTPRRGGCWSSIATTCGWWPAR